MICIFAGLKVPIYKYICFDDNEINHGWLILEDKKCLLPSRDPFSEELRQIVRASLNPFFVVEQSYDRVEVFILQLAMDTFESC
jgi:hypothetical protein